MGIDLGTSSVKTIISDIDGNIKAIGQEEYKIEIPHEGYAEQQPEEWFRDGYLCIGAGSMQAYCKV